MVVVEYAVPAAVNCTVILALAPELETLIGVKFANVLELLNVTLTPDRVIPPVVLNGALDKPPVVSDV